MRLIKTPTLNPTVLLLLLALAGVAAVLLGVYLLFGAAVTLITGGVAAVATSLLVDI